jgi:Protein of unknown function (DUF1203)
MEHTMNFRITGLSATPFRHLYGLSEAELNRFGAKRYQVDEVPGFPDRVEMREARLDETVLLLNHVFQPANTPYHGSHAIFVREGAEAQFDAINTVPEVMQKRLLSLRAFDRADMIADADVLQGKDIEAAIARLFDIPDVAYIHVHNAKRGCYSGRIDRA